MKLTGFLCLLFFMAAPLQAQVQVGESGSLSGLVFGDYYYIVNHHHESLEDNNGFWIRRVYLTYDQTHSDAFSSRLRLEMNSPGDFVSGGSMIPFVKDAYLKWENARHALYAGISSVPALVLVENVWGYRQVEKTPLDLQRMVSSRDLGLAASGSLDREGRWNYHAMFGNGHGVGPEIDEGKNLMLSLSYQVTDDWVAELYVDRNFSESSRYYTLQGFAGYVTDNLTFGAQYADQLREDAGIGREDTRIRLASAFVHTSFSESTRGFVRVDRMFDPNPGGEGIGYLPFHNQSESTLLIAGVDVDLDHNIHLIPNIEAIVYGETPAGAEPDTDIIPRLTMFYRF